MTYFALVCLFYVAFYSYRYYKNKNDNDNDPFVYPT